MRVEFIKTLWIELRQYINEVYNFLYVSLNETYKRWTYVNEILWAWTKMEINVTYIHVSVSTK